MSLNNLFSPIDLGTCTCPNRVVMAPINNGLLSTDETWPMRTILYYEERAKGGTGMIITGAVRVSELAGIPKVGIFHERFVPNHKKLVDRIHKYDTKIFCQLTLNGGKVGKEAPSAIYNPAYPCKPVELTTKQLDGLVEDFIRAAGFARDAGYDGVEIHGGHTYFVGSMMSPSTNKRTDKYGGDFEGRMKFPTDVILGIRERYGDFPAGIKFSAYEELPGGIDEKLGVEIARHLAELKPAYLHVSATSTSLMIKSRFSSVPHMYIGRNTLMPLSVKVKAVAGDVPVMATGGILVPDEAEKFIADGECDLVAVGRGVVADPYWAKKAENGEAAQIAPCIRCNVCYEQLWISEPLICTMNPYVSREAEQDLSAAARKKKVLVVGAGPAGIRCAVTASRRGHDVTIYDKKPVLGGMVYPGSKPAFKDELKLAINFYQAQLEGSGVSLKLDTEVTPELVDKEQPDAIVIAIGAKAIVPNIPGIDKDHVVSALDVLNEVSNFSGKKAVIIGGGEVGCETACHLADNGYDATIVEMLPDVMSDSSKITKNHMDLLLEDRNITIMSGVPVTAVTDEGVELRLKSGKLWGIDADLVVYASGMVGYTQSSGSSGPAMKVTAKKGLIPELSMKADEVHIIGDCCGPARILEATAEGERIGRWL